MKKFLYGILATLGILVLLGATGIVTGGWRFDDKLNCMWASVTGSPSACLMNARGVTDGSSAAAGMVGEIYQVVGSTSYTTGAGADLTVATLPLPPGRWFIRALCNGVIATSISTASYTTCEINYDGSAISEPNQSTNIDRPSLRFAMDNDSADTQGRISASLRPFMKSSPTPFTVYLRVRINAVGVNLGADGYIVAVRY